MHFLFFIPHLDGEKRSLEDIGFDDFEGAEHYETARTPTGRAGFLYGWRRPSDPVDARQLAYLPDSQTWVESDDKSYWIGFWNKYPPRPDELQKKPEPEGLSVLLQDGCQWIIPLVASFPHVVYFVENGSQRRCHEAYAAVWDLSCEVAQMIQSEEFLIQPSRYVDQFAYYALGVLRHHYRITPEVANHLELFTDQNLIEVVLKSLAGHESLPGLLEETP